MRGGSIRPYLASIAARHMQNGLPSPVDDPLVRATRRGFRAEDVRRAGGPAVGSAPLPASVASAALDRALAVPTPPRTPAAARSLRANGLVALNFLLCARPATVRTMRVTDVRILPDAIDVQLRHFKYSETGLIPRLSLRIPTATGLNTADPVRILLERLTALESPSGLLFPGPRGKPATARMLAVTIHNLLRDTNTLPPLGSKFTPPVAPQRGDLRSLFCGRATGGCHAPLQPFGPQDRH